MERLSKTLIILGGVCIVLALFMKFPVATKVLPPMMYLNWLRLADTLLLFSIALYVVMPRKK